MLPSVRQGIRLGRIHWNKLGKRKGYVRLGYESPSSWFSENRATGLTKYELDLVAVQVRWGEVCSEPADDYIQWCGTETGNCWNRRVMGNTRSRLEECLR